ncbi:MAG: 2-oxoacid:ferredoxin oxidoreductase subunit beta [Gemmatimonadetes bacterium]|nr:MAG: 2-oxoacid:ferredoxin oxidoreductase subunit beta [Gemmatimonadota bacterium]
MSTQIAPNLKAKDFASDQTVRWCPGCGDYAILSAIQKTLPKVGVPRENTVIVSGIGCSSRLPYYMNTYGFHTIHGRGATIATGIKLANPELMVWLVTGDGDSISIGGNHLIHLLRRNVNINVLLFNNEIYGLTKGQYSPTSKQGVVTKSTPFGSLDEPFRPTSLALSAEAAFVARTMDKDVKHMSQMIERCAQHTGTSFLEIFQNCVIFNDGVFEPLTNKATRPDTVLYLEHGKPMIFGQNRQKGIRLLDGTPDVVDLSTGELGLDDLWIHDEKDPDPARAFILSRMGQHPDLPTPVGVFRNVPRPTYEELLIDQIEMVKAQKGKGDLKSLFYSGDVWEVGNTPINR